MWICLLVAGSLACTVSPVSASAPGPLAQAGAGARGAFVPGEAIVRFEPGTSAAVRRSARRGADVELIDALALRRAELVDLDGSVRAAVRRLERQPGVAFAQPNYRYSADAVEPPDDSFFDDLWGLSDPALPDPGVGVLDAWENNQGSGQVIAVLDTGVDLTHPDLVGNLWSNPSPDPTDQDLHGFDFVDDDGDPDDYAFHGTHVAGTAAAVAGNTEGIAGVAPKAQIMAVRVLDGDGEGTTEDIVAGIEYAAERNADVINMSLSGPAGSGDVAMAEAIETAGETKGVVVVAAAGNDGTDNDVEPASPCSLAPANIICVAALSQKSGALATFSNYGAATVDIAAPGTNVLSAKPDYGSPLFSDGFDSGFGTVWNTAATSGGIEWDMASIGGNQLATDSLGVGQDYAPEAISALFGADPIDLSGEHGCRIRFSTMYEIEEFFDRFEVGAFSAGPTFDLLTLDGTSFGYPTLLGLEEASISDLDGAEVRVLFRVVSDELEELDGAYVDDVQLRCRDDEYDASNYQHLQGTSMAAPHVAGEVALVRAAAPALGPEEVVAAVLDGASAIPAFVTGKRTVTEGIADACKAVTLATGGDVSASCPASSNPVLQSAGSGGTQPPAIPVAPDTQTPNPAPTGRIPGSDRVRPLTFLRRRPAKAVVAPNGQVKVVFRFGSNERGVRFLCQFDRRRFSGCPARLVLRIGPGRHVLRVKARDAAGNTDRTPVVYRFRVERAG